MTVGAISAAVSCSEPLAAEAGGQILAAGGNAVDAALAAAFVQGVVNPLMCGIGGTGRMMVHLRASGRTELADFGTKAGERSRPDSYGEVEQSLFANRFRAPDWSNYIGHRAVAIPSFVRGAWDSHRAYGELDWAEVLQPAIDLAEHGFTVDEDTFGTWDPDKVRHTDSPPPLQKLRATDECARIYLRSDGDVYRAGDTLVQSDYGRTLRRIAEEGAEVFYSGDIAEAIVEDFDANDGLFTADDLRRCWTEFREPCRGRFKGMEVFTDWSPSMGPLEIEALQILDALDLRHLGWRSPEYYDVLARVFQQIYRDRTRWNADPAFAEVPVERMLSRERAERLAEYLLESEPGPPPAGPDGGIIAPDETTHVSVVDERGNGASMTHSNGNTAGVVTPGLGFLFNHHMHNFDPRPGSLNEVAPGKRPMFGCQPLMLLEDGELRAVSGSKSRYRVTAELQVFVDVFEFGASLEDALAAPRIHAEYDPATIHVESAVSSSVVEGLDAMGWSCLGNEMGVPMCTVLAQPGGGVEAVADPRGGGGLWTS